MHCKSNTFTIILIAVVALCQTVTANAQKRRTNASAVKKAVTPTEDFNHWRENPVCRVLIADSLVTDKESVSAHIPLPSHLGRFVSDRESGTVCHENDFGDQRLLSLPDTSGLCHLYRRTLLDGRWGDAEAVTVQGDCYDLRNPFPMPDGQTLYFAARNASDNDGHCLSLYTTTYDSETDTYLSPQRLPYPFRSSADDLYYIEDEADTLSWLVTTRRQAQGQVCIYTMRVSQPWEYHDADTTAGPRLKALARIERIADTWPSEAARNATLQAVQALRNTLPTAKADASMRFIINDNRVVNNPDEFANEKSRVLYASYLDEKRKAKAAERQIDEFRHLFHNTAYEARPELAATIEQAAKRREEAETKAEALAKEIRKIELQ